MECAEELPVREAFYRGSLTLLLHITTASKLERGEPGQDVVIALPRRSAVWLVRKQFFART